MLLKMEKDPQWVSEGEAAPGDRGTITFVPTPKNVSQFTPSGGGALPTMSVSWRIARATLLTSKSAAKLKDRFKLVVVVGFPNDRIRVSDLYLHIPMGGRAGMPEDRELYPHISDLVLKLMGFPHDHMLGKVHWDVVTFNMAALINAFYTEKVRAEEAEEQRKRDIIDRAQASLQQGGNAAVVL